MNKLSLFKSGDLFDLIKESLRHYDGTFEDTTDDLYEYYDIEYEDVFENDEHYLDVTILETSEHFPWQVGDVSRAVNNKFRIKVECLGEM